MAFVAPGPDVVKQTPTVLLENGANIKDIQNRLGHSQLSTTMDTYSHVTDKMKNETVDI
ncbi:tyrosine-type recombinase/integrase, partial [Clostridioides difficile]